MMATIREYLQYTPYQPSDSPDSPTPTTQYLPYSTQFQQISSLPSEKLAIDESEYSGFLPLWAELSLSEKDPVYSTYIPQPEKKQTQKSQTTATTEKPSTKGSAYLPRFQMPPQPTKKETEYSSFFCKECGCPLADRYGLHDLEDDDDWKEEYESCPVNEQTRQWARSLELLRAAEQESKNFLGRERRRPKHLPKIDTGVSNRYRTGLQHLV